MERYCVREKMGEEEVIDMDWNNVTRGIIGDEPRSRGPSRPEFECAFTEAQSCLLEWLPANSIQSPLPPSPPTQFPPLVSAFDKHCAPSEALVVDPDQ